MKNSNLLECLPPTPRGLGALSHPHWSSPPVDQTGYLGSVHLGWWGRYDAGRRPYGTRGLTLGCNRLLFGEENKLIWCYLMPFCNKVWETGCRSQVFWVICSTGRFGLWICLDLDLSDELTWLCWLWGSTDIAGSMDCIEKGGDIEIDWMDFAGGAEIFGSSAPLYQRNQGSERA